MRDDANVVPAVTRAAARKGVLFGLAAALIWIKTDLR